MNHTCKDCKYAQPVPGDLFGKARTCFRNPPSVFPVFNPQGSVGLVMMRVQVNESDNACGEFILEPEKTQ